MHSQWRRTENLWVRLVSLLCFWGVRPRHILKPIKARDRLRGMGRRKNSSGGGLAHPLKLQKVGNFCLTMTLLKQPVLFHDAIRQAVAEPRTDVPPGHHRCALVAPPVQIARAQRANVPRLRGIMRLPWPTSPMLWNGIPDACQNQEAAPATMTALQSASKSGSWSGKCNTHTAKQQEKKKVSDQHLHSK